MTFVARPGKRPRLPGPVCVRRTGRRTALQAGRSNAAGAAFPRTDPVVAAGGCAQRTFGAFLGEVLGGSARKSPFRPAAFAWAPLVVVHAVAFVGATLVVAHQATAAANSPWPPLLPPWLRGASPQARRWGDRTARCVRGRVRLQHKSAGSYFHPNGCPKGRMTTTVQKTRRLRRVKERHVRTQRDGRIAAGWRRQKGEHEYIRFRQPEQGISRAAPSICTARISLTYPQNLSPCQRRWISMLGGRRNRALCSDCGRVPRKRASGDKTVDDYRKEPSHDGTPHGVSPSCQTSATCDPGTP